jgi:hypothetical protein
MFHVVHRTPLGIILEQDVEATTIEEVVDILNLPVNTLPTICILDDKPVLRKHWKTIDHELLEEFETDSRELVFTTIPQGNTFKSILSLVASIALTIVAPYAAGFLAPMLGITSTIGIQLLAAGIVLAGTFLIGTFLNPTPNTKAAEQEQASPTYSLVGQSNQARLFSPIPRLYGKHLLFPDYAAQPYSEYIGNDQYLYQLFCLGIGTYDLHSIRIDDTEIWNTSGLTGVFSGITIQKVEPGQAVTLFHSQVINSVEVGGQELESPSEWSGPFVANPADTITNKLQVDIIFPQGLFYTNDKGELVNESATVQVQGRLVNSAGIPIGSYFDLGVHTYTRRTLTPQRITETYNVSDGRYEVRVRRYTAKNTSTRSRSDVQWGALKAYIPDDNIYPDVTLLAVRMLATGQLTQSSSKRFNTIQTARLPIWNAGTQSWSAPTPTRSIAWAAADVLRNTLYGAGYPDAYIDLDKLAELDAVWTARGDTFNGVFDTTYSIWEALTLILRTGRTSPAMIAGNITFVRDEPRLIPRGQFTPANIKRGSMDVQHILFDEESPDDIIVQFMDERTWKRNEVQCKQVGSVSNKPERMEFFGITDRLQAWREGMFIGAVNAKRRIVASFTTEMEGRLLMRGDLVSVAHDLYEWGQTGVIEGYSTFTRELWLSEPMDWSDNTEAFIRLRKRNGESWGPVRILPGSEDYIVVVDGADLTIVQATQGPITNVFNLEEDSALTTYVICYQETEYKDFIIISGQPKDELVDLTCIIEDPSVHFADLGTPPSEVYPYTGITNPSRPIITFFSMSEDITSDPNNPTVVFAWSPSTQATSYYLEISYNNIDWELLYTGPNTSFVSQVVAGPLWARVRGLNTAAGPWKTADGVFGIGSMVPLPTPEITYVYSVSGGNLSIEWENAIRATSYRLEIYSESTPGSGVFDTLELTRLTVGTSIQFNSNDILAVGGPWPAIRIRVVSINDLGESTPADEDVAGIELDPVTNLSLQAVYNRNTFTVQWTASNANSYTVKVYVDGIEELSYNSLSNTQQITLSDMQTVGGPWRELVVGVTAVAGILTSPEAILTIRAPTITPVTGAGGTYDGTEVSLSWTQTIDNGVEQTKIYRNDTNDFATATLLNTQTKAAGETVSYDDPRDPIDDEGTWYYYITAYDPDTTQESVPVGLMITIEP